MVRPAATIAATATTRTLCFVGTCGPVHETRRQFLAVGLRATLIAILVRGLRVADLALAVILHAIAIAVLAAVTAAIVATAMIAAAIAMRTIFIRGLAYGSAWG